MEWIDIDDKYPQINEIVLVLDELNAFITLGKLIELDDDEHRFKLIHIDNIELDFVITHWMPLPSLPPWI